MTMRIALAFTLALWAAAPRPVLLAQHETAADLLDGERAFRNNCANCHGPDGDLIAGIDLGRGQFRRPLSDDDLVRIIRTGIPNTPMPATNMTVEQASQIVAYLRSLAATKKASAVTGDAARGKAVFDGKGACTTCHRVDGSGSRVGPDLSRIGGSRQAVELERALLEILDAQEQLRSFVKADLREHGFAATPMPSYKGRLTPQEIADVVKYLASLTN